MVKIRRFRVSDTKEVVSLIRNTFSKYNREGTEEGIKNYLHLYSIENNNIERLKTSFLKYPIFFVALDGEKIVGIIRGNKEKLVNLFVLGSYHKQGIGRKLVEKFEKQCWADGSEKIRMRASIFAIPFYEKMGYKKTTGVRKFRGLKIQPMQKHSIR